MLKMKCFVVVFSLCVLATAVAAAAMLPRDTQSTVASTNATTQAATGATPTKQKTPVICASYTPCAWQVYEPGSQRPLTFFNNTFCICSNTTSCQEFDDDKTVYSIIYRCLDKTASSEAETNNS